MNKKIVVGKMIRFFLDENNMTMKELGKKLGKTESTVSKWISGKSTPLAKDLSKMTNIFNVDIETLLYGGQEEILSKIIKTTSNLDSNRQKCVYNFAKAQLEDQKGKSDNVFEMHRSFHEIKLAGIVSAGTGEFQADDAAKETIPYYGTIPAHDYALRVNGDSMSPMLENQQIIFVRKSNGAELHTGQIIVAMLNGDSYVKKIDLNDHCVKLVSLNPKYKPIRVIPTDKFMVQGVVLL